MLIAKIIEIVLNTVSNVIPHASRDADPTRSSQALQPCRDIHAIAEDVAVLDHDITDIDPDAKLHPALRRKRGVRFRKGLLNGHPAVHGIDDAGELSEYTVPRAARDMSASSRYEPVDDGAMRG